MGIEGVCLTFRPIQIIIFYARNHGLGGNSFARFVEDVKEEATIEGSTEDLEANLVDSPPVQRLEKGGFSRKIR